MCFFGDGFSWGMPFAGIGMFLFWAAIIAFGIWVVIRLTRRESSGSKTHDGSDPLEIAKRRYAKGEISKAEFDQIKDDLKYNRLSDDNRTGFAPPPLLVRDLEGDTKISLGFLWGL
ncbi:SHOCT domain-containing protein [Chloroflexota bacterium]